MNIKPGQNIGPYYIEESLGAGGFARVWQAIDLRSNSRVALKALRIQLIEENGGKGPSVVERFLEEAELLRSLRHPGVVRVLDIIDMRKAGLVAFTMEHLVGKDLSKAGRTMSLPELLDAYAEAATSLQYLHDRGVVHRDVKASNIYAVNVPGQRPRIVLLDLGIAKDLLARGNRDQTATGMFVGTLEAMAPEMLASAQQTSSGSRSLTVAADQWGLGIALFAALTGKRPFRSEAFFDLMTMILNNPTPKMVPQARFQLNAMPEGLQAIVDRCLQKRPEHRFESMKDIAARLRGARDALISGDLTARLSRPCPSLDPEAAAFAAVGNNSDHRWSDVTALTELDLAV